MNNILIAGIAMMLVFEGILPFVAPRIWRESIRRVIELTDQQLRFAGFAAMLAGLLILSWVN